MRNLKKVLSLALAFVMLVGMMVVGAGAVTTTKDYTDGADVNYTEAVDVMSAIGVFDGANGTFAPQGDLTRAQAAKIITYMLLGKEAADKLGTLTAPYTDVAASYWAAGSIAYCTNMGIVSGIGNGQFGPDAQVTGYQFAKMLLVALGYDSEREGLTGSDWTINVSKLAITSALDVGVDNGTDIALDKPLTREEAAQMAFNTVKAPMVEYATTGSSIIVGNTPITIGGSTATIVESPRSYASNIYTATGVGGQKILEFGERYFQTLTLADNNTTDEYGRPAHIWKVGKDVVGTYADDSVLTYTSDCTSGGSKDALIRDLNGYDISGLKQANVIVNGMPMGDASTSVTAADVAGLTANGKLVEVFSDNKGNIIKVVTVETVIGNVTGVNTSKKTVTFTGGLYTFTVDEYSPLYSVVSGLSAKDKVLVTIKGDSDHSLMNVVVPQMVTGTLTSIATGNKPNTAGTVNGTTYTAAHNSQPANGSEGSATLAQVFKGLDLNKDVNVWLDEYGYAKAVEGVAVDTNANYIYLTNIYKETTTNYGVPTTKVFARGVLTDGSVATLEVFGTEGKTTDNVHAAGFANVTLATDNIAANPGEAYKFTANGDAFNLQTVSSDPKSPVGVVVEYVQSSTKSDQYLLVCPAVATSSAAGAATYVKGGNDNIADNHKAHSTLNVSYSTAVQFVYVNFDSESQALTSTVREGVQTVNNTSGGADYTVIVSEVGSDKLITTVFVASNYVNSSELIYIDNKDATKTTFVNADGKVVNGWTYTAYVNGEQRAITTTAANQLGFFTYAEDGAGYKLTAYGGNNTTTDKVSGLYNGQLSLNDAGETVDIDNSKVVDLSNVYNVSDAAGIKALLDADCTVYVSTTWNANGQADCVYVVKVADAGDKSLTATWKLASEAATNVTFYNSAEEAVAHAVEVADGDKDKAITITPTTNNDNATVAYTTCDVADLDTAPTYTAFTNGTTTPSSTANNYRIVKVTVTAADSTKQDYFVAFKTLKGALSVKIGETALTTTSTSSNPVDAGTVDKDATVSVTISNNSGDPDVSYCVTTWADASVNEIADHGTTVPATATNTNNQVVIIKVVVDGNTYYGKVRVVNNVVTSSVKDSTGNAIASSAAASAETGISSATGVATTGGSTVTLEIAATDSNAVVKVEVVKEYTSDFDQSSASEIEPNENDGTYTFTASSTSGKDDVVKVTITAEDGTTKSVTYYKFTIS